MLMEFLTAWLTPDSFTNNTEKLNPLMNLTPQNGQTNAARLLKCAWPFLDVMH